MPNLPARVVPVLLACLLHYYGGDYQKGGALLVRFNAMFPAHRWHDEGVRFQGICERLEKQRAASPKGGEQGKGG